MLAQIGNGIIDYYTQAPYSPEFAIKNTYGIVAVNETVFDYMIFALNMIGGCLYQIDSCRETNMSSLVDKAICAEAEDMCRDNVEGTIEILPAEEPTIFVSPRLPPSHQHNSWSNT